MNLICPFINCINSDQKAMSRFHHGGAVLFLSFYAELCGVVFKHAKGDCVIITMLLFYKHFMNQEGGKSQGFFHIGSATHPSELTKN